ncbi:DNA internalization-related competence protein ComEC/Rec2 [Idiomarina xiamenensis]|uniref:DNA uptake-related membrane-associated competence protein n=1 Tax=Idiomarina xiamenensis 10-D-4 TaxID=740709 RepID=K2K8S0_9GAMM|nr:DNA internalization-related competence protein ComEC/Rec2 [Idiomarina xiamenensis]EKE82962.1 DNA uptake-related membrane-associated competence protein [Idiomarina xiamenensis 10-D-4]
MERCLLAGLVGATLALYLATQPAAPQLLVYSLSLSLSLTVISAWLKRATWLKPYKLKSCCARKTVLPHHVYWLMMAALIGFSYIQWQTLRATPLPLAMLNAQSASITLLIDDIPAKKPGRLIIYGRLQDPVCWPWWASVPRVRLTWYVDQQNLAQTPQAGQQWRFKVRLKAPDGLFNQGGFNYPRYLWRHQVRAQGSIREGVLLHQPTATNTLRQRLYQQLQQADLKLPWLVAALAIAYRGDIDDSTWTIWQRTGVAHLLAISGLHLGLVAIGVSYGLRWLLRRLSGRRRAAQEVSQVWRYTLILAWLMGWFYAGLAGFPTSVLRAMGLWTVLFATQLLGLTFTRVRLILVVLSLLLLLDPWLWLDSGFWLSLTAVIALMWSHWRWQQQSSSASWRWFKPVLALLRVEFILLLGLWPLQNSLFHGVSPLAPWINLLWVPLFSFWLVPLVLIGSLLALAGIPLAAQFCWQLAEQPMIYLQPLLSHVAEQPWSWWPLAQQPSLWLASAAIVVLAMPLNWRLRLAMLTLLSVIQLSITYRRERDPYLRLHVLDVGQSQALVIERQGKAMLVDTGIAYGSGFSMAAAVIIPFLQQRQLQPEVAWLSHHDRDHAGGYLRLTEQYPQLRWSGDQQHPCQQGQAGVWRGVQWQVLWPQQAKYPAANDDSCVLALRFHQFKLLLPGDLLRTAEQHLVKTRPQQLDSDVLVLPHHGSRSSSSQAFLRQVKPSLALLSRAANNRYGFPHAAVLQRLAEQSVVVADTARWGQLSVISDGYRWQLQLPYASQTRRWRRLN